MTQDAEMMRHSLTRDVPDRCLVSSTLQGGDVGIRVLGTDAGRRLLGVHALVVLVGEHQHLVTRVLCQAVGEGLTRPLPLAGAVAGEPHLDLVARLGTPYDSAELGVVDLGLVAVAFTAAPFADWDS